MIDTFVVHINKCNIKILMFPQKTFLIFAIKSLLLLLPVPNIYYSIPGVGRQLMFAG